MGATDAIEEAVERGDLDELTRFVDRLCAAADWNGVVELRDRCRWALQRGRQLWPAATFADYRLALEAPGPFAAPAAAEGSSRFALGPLAEVAASTHRWRELAPHLEPGSVTAAIAHERVVRGEDLTGDSLVADSGDRTLDLPLSLQPWEPRYAVATYEADRADFPAPTRPAVAIVELPAAGAVVDDLVVDNALRELVRAWVEESNGRADVVAVEGSALGAIAALGIRRARAATVDAADALAHLAWAGASGGAHGRRRGAAVGRLNAWWAAAALAGVDDAGRESAAELGGAIAELHWLLWDAAEPPTGWELRIAVEDPANGVAWAISASDAALE